MPWLDQRGAVRSSAVRERTSAVQLRCLKAVSSGFVFSCFFFKTVGWKIYRAWHVSGLSIDVSKTVYMNGLLVVRVAKHLFDHR